MARRFVGTVAAFAGVLMAAGCVDFTPLCSSLDDSSVRVYLINDSNSFLVSPKLGVCPNGLSTEPHFFIDPPVLRPGEVARYTTRQIAGTQGDCSEAGSAFSIGLCGWGFGSCSCSMTQIAKRYGGQIGTQFHCGDTILLRWTDAGETGGTWTSEVLPATGNEPPTADFQIIP
jgi:hypothetical protein